MSVPIYSNWSPQKASMGAQINAPIYFEVTDVVDGLDKNTLNIKINGIDAVINGVFQPGYHGAISLLDPLPKKLAILVIKNTDWNYNETVDLIVTIEDQIGTVGSDHWGFVVTLTYSDFSPAKNAIGVELSAPIRFKMTDDVNGLDQNTLDIKFGTTSFTVSNVTILPAIGDHYTTPGATLLCLFQIEYVSTILIRARRIPIPPTPPDTDPDLMLDNPLASGVLTRVTGSGDITIAYSAVIDDDAVIDGVFQAGYHGTITPLDPLPKKIDILVKRDTDWFYGELVTTAVKIKDLTATFTYNDFWHFLTIPNPDHTPPTVAANPHGGIFNSAQTVTLSSTELVTIYYTLDGTAPNLHSPVYSAPLSITHEGTTTLKFLGVDSNNNYDSHTEVYEIDTIAPVTHAEPAGGSYFGSQQVRLISNDSRATIYYTTNGTVPNVHSPVYTTPITLRNNYTTRVKYFAIDKAGNIEAVKTDVYTIEIAKNNYRATNVNVMASYSNALDIKWDDMYEVLTTKIIGYNVYRADVEIGPYVKLNQSLLTVTQYQDKTLDTDVIEEDVSEQFRRTSIINTQVNDDFDTPTYNCAKWIETDVAELLFQFNGLIFSDKVGLRQESKLTSKFKLRGDFDITIDFDLLKWAQPATTIQSCIFRVKLTDEDFIQIARDRSNSANVYSANKYTNGNPDLPITVATTNEYGTFELKRVGNIITAYFFDKNTSTFISINAFTAYTEDLYVEIVGKSGDVAVECRWTKFELKTGAPIIIEPLNPRKEVWIQVQKPPIVDNSGTNKATDDINNVLVTINGMPAAIKLLQGTEGLIQLEIERAYDEVKKLWYVPPVPDEHSIVLVTYKTKLQTTKLGLRKKYFYKVTCLTVEDETDLDLLEPEYVKPEKMDYIYQEAVRRNQWLLEHAGERVLLYLKKKAGTVCPCMTRDVKIRSHIRADQDCSSCYGSGFVGGFDGPHAIIIANLTTEQRLMQTERGMKLNYQIETWTGPFPIVAQRDMILRRNGDRVLVGPLTNVEGPGGVIVQQHFSIEIIDTTDIRYKFPIKPLPNQFVQPGIDKPGKFVPEVNSPKESDELRTSRNSKAVDTEFETVNPDRNKVVDHIVKGRSITFENINL